MTGFLVTVENSGTLLSFQLPGAPLQPDSDFRGSSPGTVMESHLLPLSLVPESGIDVAF